MDYEKLKEYGRGIKLTDEAKAEITAKCRAVLSEEREKSEGITLALAFKRTAAVLAAAAVIIAGIACIKYLKQPAPSINNTEKSSTVINSTESLQTEATTETNNVETTEDGAGGGELTLQKYRSIYYSIPSPFWDIVDENSRQDIYGEYWEQPYSQINTMRMKIFVEEYNVPREKFDAANAEWARIVKERLYGTPVINPQDFANQEFNEVYNADIIYTFDDEIINEYYLSHDYPYCYESEYEKAVEDGLYITRTDKIIDMSELEDELAFYNQLKNETSTDNANPTESATSIPNGTETTE